MNWIKRGKEKTLKDVFLRNIGASSLDEINGWFEKSFKNGYTIKDMDKAVSLALEYIDKPVRIIGDYDVDGTTATSTLLLGLRDKGFKNVSYRIPKRFSEGFGINETIIDEVDEGLIITCDNGIAQVDAIKKAKDKGLAVIIIDHHEPSIVDGKKILPPADVIIDPKAIEGSAEFNDYCGCGLCFKFIKALGCSKRMMGIAYGLAALGTVADVVSLREENYVFVKQGFKSLLNPTLTTSGIYALISSFDLTRHLTAKDIGFKLGPALNACSRMNDDGARIAVELLTYQGSFPSAIPKAEKVIAINDERKELKKRGLIEAENVITENILFGDVPIIIRVDVPEGIIGIIAGNICENYGVPAIVVCKTQEGILKGSGRAPEGYDMKAHLDMASEYLLRYGGHTGAAGLSLLEENFDDFCNKLHEVSEDFSPKTETDNCFVYDLEIEAKQMPEVISELDKYEPFGMGNPMPVFKVVNYSVNPKGGNYLSKVASTYDIVKLYYKKDIVAIGFDMSARFNNVVPKKVDLIGTLSDRYYNGEMSHQVEFVDFTKEDLAKIETPLAEKLKAMAMATKTT